MTALITTSGGDFEDMLPAYRKIADPMAWCVEVGKAFQVTFNLTSPHHGTVMALTCLAENIPPTIYNQRYHGDGSMRASAIQARFMERGGKIEWLNIGDEGAAAIAKFSHPSQPNAIEIAYTIGDATKQVGDKITKPGSNWATNPGAMLRAALIRKAIKIIDPGIIGGFDSFSEFADQQPTAPADKPAAKKSRAERAEELKNETAAVVTGETVATYTAEPETIIDAVIETPPFETATTATTTVPDDSEEPATPDLLQELVTLGKKIPSPSGSGTGMDLREIADGVCKACKVEKPQQATRKQIRSLIAKFRATLGEK